MPVTPRPTRRRPTPTPAPGIEASDLVTLADALAGRVPAGPAGDSARARLAALRALPPEHADGELPELLASFERDVVGPGGNEDTEHEALRALIRDAHPALLALPELARWLDAPRRHAAMLAWLLRDQVERLQHADRAVGASVPADAPLRQELARMREEHAALVRELEDRRTQADVGLMAAGMVHDVNSVLHVIAGHAQILRASAGPREKRSLDAIEEAAHRAAELSRTLLRWVRHGRPEPEPVDLSAIAHEVVDLLASSAPVRVLMVHRMATGLPPVLADPIEIRRVVLNLVVNAWQAIGDGPGEIAVATGVSRDEAGEVWLEVTDDGRGMSVETCARVFEPFFTTRTGGTGLGLATVRSIAEHAGGRIEVWSQPGRGARFRVSLPAMHAGEDAGR